MRHRRDTWPRFRCCRRASPRWRSIPWTARRDCCARSAATGGAEATGASRRGSRAQLPAGRAAVYVVVPPVWLPVELLVDPQALTRPRTSARSFHHVPPFHQHRPTLFDCRQTARATISCGYRGGTSTGSRIPTCRAANRKKAVTGWWPLSSSKRGGCWWRSDGLTRRDRWPGNSRAARSSRANHPARPWCREIEEELACSIEVGAVVDVVFFAYDAFDLIMPVYRASIRAGVPVARQVAAVAGWHAPKLPTLAFTPADVPWLAAWGGEPPNEGDCRGSRLGR